MARTRATAAPASPAVPSASGPVPVPPASGPVPVPDELAGRFAITAVEPTSLSGRRPAAAAVGEAVPVTATAFREGHDSLGMTLLLHRPDGTLSAAVRMAPEGVGLDRWTATVRPDAVGDWHFSLEAWGSPWDTWVHHATIKVPAGVDVELEFTEGSHLLIQAAADTSLGPEQQERLRAAATTLTSTALPIPVRLAAATDPGVAQILHDHPLRVGVTTSGPWPLRVQRRRALVGSWYEFFPRSEGACLTPPASGTFATAAERLPAIAAMGFDVVYLPPIHPIGAINRKGPNNTLTPVPGDPGSPWAIGSADGGHDAVHPDLGTLEDFTAFVTRAAELGLEIALDLALQAAPDHPWVAEHPEWFTTRADGSIAYAENPPKKYQDIYPLNFDNDPEGLFAEVERIVRFWMSHGVRIFRVDNPHTKPLWVWDRLLGRIFQTDPDVLFLAEAFTRPPMMKALAQVGYQQSYTYFTWRNTADEIRSYVSELAGPSSAYMRPNLFVNTPDILPEYLQNSGPAGFAIRATLAATLSPTYGVYSGYELYEHVAVRPGTEEYLDSEKYQYRPRDWDRAEATGMSLAPYLTRLNEWRRAHPALQDLRSLRFHHSDNPQVLAYSKRDGDDIVLVVCTLDSSRVQESTIWWDTDALGLGERFIAHDLATDTRWTWTPRTYVRLSPADQVAHVVHARRA